MAAICDMMYTVPYSKRARFTRGTYAMPRYLQILRDCGPIAASRSFDYELWADRGPIPESIARYMLHCNCDEQKEPPSITHIHGIATNAVGSIITC